ncbi:MAG: flagellin [Oscillospiraceae bacterium]|jgi:flagellar hook-associated protein 3 FlgL
MRITNSMMVSQFLYDTNGSMSRLSKYQNQVTSTKRITNISDDPLATITALRARNKLSNLTYYKSNISAAGSYLKEAESSVSELNEIIKTVYEQVVSAISGGKTQDELDIIAEELENLKNEVLDIGNATIGNTYIFGGYNFTGSTDGTDRIAPFRVDEATGHIFYNGIDISMFAWKDEFSASISLMGNAFKTIIEDVDSQFSKAPLSGYDSGDKSQRDYLDHFVKENLGVQLKNALSQLTAYGENLLYAAKQFGVSETETGYKEVAEFVSELSKLNEQLGLELSKELLGEKRIAENDPDIINGIIDDDYCQENGITVITAEERNNFFSVDAFRKILKGYNDESGTYIKGIVDFLNEQFEIVDGKVTPKEDKAITKLDGAMVLAETPEKVTEIENAYKNEQSKQAKLQIGVSQTVEFTLNGLELMGTGKDNIYHILDKCVKMLRGELNPDGLKNMVTTLQKKQSDILNSQTKIGSIQNKLELISSRYDSSEINYTEMRSEAEDADMAEAIMNFTTAKTVYSAALASGAKMLQISLIDFLR